MFNVIPKTRHALKDSNDFLATLEKNPFTVKVLLPCFIRI